MSRRTFSPECVRFLRPFSEYLQTLCCVNGQASSKQLTAFFERVVKQMQTAPTRECSVALCLLSLEYFESASGMAFLRASPAIREAVIRKVIELSRDKEYGHLFYKLLFHPGWIRMYIHDGCQEILATPALRRNEDLVRLRRWRITTA